MQVVADKLTKSIRSKRPFWIGNGHPAAKFKGRIDELSVFRRVLSHEEVQQLPGLAIDSLLAVNPTDRNEDQAQRIRNHFLEHHASKQWRDLFQDQDRLTKDLKTARRDLPTVMVMQDGPKARKTQILIRGVFDQPGESVQADTPAVLPGLPQGAAPNRLSLARWLVDPQHPLTARVTVNRYWQKYFGRGLVETAEDFGIQGARPTHPELLDWLAVSWVRDGWDIKRIQRRIVTSATYQQGSQVSEALLSRDPRNLLLARGPSIPLARRTDSRPGVICQRIAG